MRKFSAAWTSALLAGLVTVGASVPAPAHHSFSATYMMDQTMTIKGTVMQFSLRNPHSFLHVMAPDKDGKQVLWAVEWGSGGALASENVKYDTVKPGDKVIVTGNPGRDATAHRLRVRLIERPADGWKWEGNFG